MQTQQSSAITLLVMILIAIVLGSITSYKSKFNDSLFEHFLFSIICAGLWWFIELLILGFVVLIIKAVGG